MKRQSRERAHRQATPTGGGVRGYIASPILRACKKCCAPAGHKCQSWKVESGKRMYVLRTKKKYCPERRTSPE